MPAYVRISDIYRFFETGTCFLRLEDYSVCSPEEKQALLYDDEDLSEADFLQFQECPDDIIGLFLDSIHNAPLRRRFAQYKKSLTPPDYYGMFYHIVEGELNYRYEYQQFHKDRLWAFAVQWCKKMASGTRKSEN